MRQPDTYESLAWGMSEEEEARTVLITARIGNPARLVPKRRKKNISETAPIFFDNGTRSNVEFSPVILLIHGAATVADIALGD